MVAGHACLQHARGHNARGRAWVQGRRYGDGRQGLVLRPRGWRRRRRRRRIRPRSQRDRADTHRCDARSWSSRCSSVPHLVRPRRRLGRAAIGRGHRGPGTPRSRRRSGPLRRKRRGGIATGHPRRLERSGRLLVARIAAWVPIGRALRHFGTLAPSWRAARRWLSRRRARGSCRTRGSGRPWSRAMVRGRACWSRRCRWSRAERRSISRFAGRRPATSRAIRWSMW